MGRSQHHLPVGCCGRHVDRVIWAQEWDMFHTLFLTVCLGHKLGNNNKSFWSCLLCVSDGSFQVSAQSRIKLSSVLGGKKKKGTQRNSTTSLFVLVFTADCFNLTEIQHCFLCLIFYIAPVLTRVVSMLRLGSWHPYITQINFGTFYAQK